MQIDRDLIFVNTELKTKAEAVEFLGGQLVKAGAVQPDYVKAMHTREADIGTYITEGVAIPHGTEDSRKLINKSAIAVLKIPEGIQWLPGKPVYLAFGLAGNNEEHVELLGALATMLMDEQQTERLMRTNSEDEIYAILCESICL